MSTNAYITLSGDSTMLSGPNVGHHGWGEAFSGVAQVNTPQPAFKQPWNLDKIKTDFPGKTVGVLNLGDSGSVVKRYLKSNKYQTLKDVTPEFAFIMFGQNELPATDFSTNLTKMLKDLLNNTDITPVVLSMVPFRIDTSGVISPAPQGSPDFTYASEAISVAQTLNVDSIDVFTKLQALFTQKGSDWLKNNIDAADSSGLVHYSPIGAVTISRLIASYLEENSSLCGITNYLVDTTDDSFACTANCG